MVQRLCCEFCRARFSFRDREAVSCPRCRRYQRSMFAAVRRERFAFFTVLAGLALLVGLALGVLAGEASVTAALTVTAVTLFATGRVKAARFDPNAEAPSRHA